MRGQLKSTRSTKRYSRGSTNYGAHDPATRPPKLKGGVANDFYPDKPRSAVMPPPTRDTQEPRGRPKSR